MHLQQFIATVGLTLALVFLVSVNGGGMHHKLKCLDQEINMTTCFSGWMECAAKMMPEEDVKAFKDPNTTKEKRKELQKKAHENHCIRVCQWKEHQHLLNQDGSLNATGRDAMIEKFPEGARESLKTGVTKCHEDNSKDLKDDNNCESYKPFEDCLTTAYANACKVDIKSFHMDETEE